MLLGKDFTAGRDRIYSKGTYQPVQGLQEAEESVREESCAARGYIVEYGTLVLAEVEVEAMCGCSSLH